ncbi:lipoprotein [Faucicola mancuniensis]|uniref:lipoprotein n=1 Tax=Faucicola mancuniensis TaxID=1309795 RepID=UPI0028E4CCE4|nr:lipoprotein [uncultured Moraxella sp.]
MQKILIIFGTIIFLTGCTAMQWYDSPIPVRVDLDKKNTKMPIDNTPITKP